MAAFIEPQTPEFSQAAHHTPWLSAPVVCALFVEDDRYSVPTVSFVMVEDLSELRSTADALLRASSHHLRVEARRDDILLFTLSAREDG